MAYMLPFAPKVSSSAGHQQRKPVKLLTSIISVQFREPDKKSTPDATKSWQEWADRQPDSNLRVLEVSTTNSQNVVGNAEDFALNAVKVRWIPGVIPASFHVAVRSLSTDFCRQKGVKGIPLQLQIDTYDEDATDKLNAVLLLTTVAFFL